MQKTIVIVISNIPQDYADKTSYNKMEFQSFAYLSTWMVKSHFIQFLKNWSSIVHKKESGLGITIWISSWQKYVHQSCENAGVYWYYEHKT